MLRDCDILFSPQWGWHLSFSDVIYHWDLALIILTFTPLRSDLTCRSPSGIHAVLFSYLLCNVFNYELKEIRICKLSGLHLKDIQSCQVVWFGMSFKGHQRSDLPQLGSVPHIRYSPPGGLSKYLQLPKCMTVFIFLVPFAATQSFISWQELCFSAFTGCYSNFHFYWYMWYIFVFEKFLEFDRARS